MNWSLNVDFVNVVFKKRQTAITSYLIAALHGMSGLLVDGFWRKIFFKSLTASLGKRCLHLPIPWVGMLLYCLSLTEAVEEKKKMSLLEEQIATKMEMKSILNGNSWLLFSVFSCKTNRNQWKLCPKYTWWFAFYHVYRYYIESILQ